MTHFHRRLRLALVIGTLGLLVVTSIAGGASPVTVVKVTIGDATTKFSPTTAPPVAIRFAITNTGKKAHALVIARKKSPTIAAGRTGRLDVGFTVGGKYAYRVTNGGKGGTFLIKASSGSAGANTAQLAAGKTVFKANCGTCHVLAAAGTSGSAGPNLDKVKPSLDVITQQVTQGGRFMPAFSGQLTSTQINDVAAFVYASERK